MVRKKKVNPNTLENWDAQYAKTEDAPERLSEWLWPYLKAYVPKMGTVVEVGCGRGQSIKEILDISPELECTGIDFSAKAIELSKEEHPGVTFVQADFDKRQQQIRVYDFVLCSQTLEHVDNPQLFIGNLKASVKRGGTLIITVPWPRSSLDNGVHWHINRFYPGDFTKWIQGCKVIKEGKNHMIVIYNRP